jgi:hypothetical protein
VIVVLGLHNNILVWSADLYSVLAEAGTSTSS